MKLYDSGVYLVNGNELVPDGANAIEEAVKKTGAAVTKEQAAENTIAYGILKNHNTSGNMDKLQIKFDKLTSHDITFVGIIQTARASGLEKFPIPYVLTNCHNSLCAVGGTINEDDHMFGLTCAKKYGGVYVPPHQAVIHQFAREMLAAGGAMILGSDSHTRYGALGTMAVGEGGPELVKQLLNKTYDIDMPGVIGVYLTELKELKPEQHFTQPPAHYTEASLVKTMEELGIGRPSTYAPTITTIINRRYVAKENKNLYMTELGEVVNNMMKEAFPSIVDVNFTATMEALLDRVGDGSVPWKTVVENFWPDLYEAVTEAEKNLEEVKVEDEVTDVICENCGRNMVVKYGPHGKFLACPGFPDCKNTKPYLEKIGVPCPKCGKEVILRKTKKGRKYYGCENNPECDFMSWQKPSAKKCPQCGGYMLEKGNKLVCADEQCGYVEAREKKDED